jgi:hypothetical protein
LSRPFLVRQQLVVVQIVVVDAIQALSIRKGADPHLDHRHDAQQAAIASVKKRRSVGAEAQDRCRGF